MYQLNHIKHGIEGIYRSFICFKTQIPLIKGSTWRCFSKNAPNKKSEGSLKTATSALRDLLNSDDDIPEWKKVQRTPPPWPSTHEVPNYYDKALQSMKETGWVPNKQNATKYTVERKMYKHQVHFARKVYHAEYLRQKAMKEADRKAREQEMKKTKKSTDKKKGELKKTTAVQQVKDLKEAKDKRDQEEKESAERRERDQDRIKAQGLYLLEHLEQDSKFWLKSEDDITEESFQRYTDVPGWWPQSTIDEEGWADQEDKKKMKWLLDHHVPVMDVNKHKMKALYKFLRDLNNEGFKVNMANLQRVRAMLPEDIEETDLQIQDDWLRIKASEEKKYGDVEEIPTVPEILPLEDEIVPEMEDELYEEEELQRKKKKKKDDIFMDKKIKKRMQLEAGIKPRYKKGTKKAEKEKYLGEPKEAFDKEDMEDEMEHYTPPEEEMEFDVEEEGFEIGEEDEMDDLHNEHLEEFDNKKRF